MSGPSVWLRETRNNLPQEIISATSTSALKHKLDNHWKNTGYEQVVTKTRTGLGLDDYPRSNTQLTHHMFCNYTFRGSRD